MKSSSFQIKTPSFQIKTPSLQIKTPPFQIKTPLFPFKIPSFQFKSPLFQITTLPGSFGQNPAGFAVFTQHSCLSHFGRVGGVRGTGGVQEKGWTKFEPLPPPRHPPPSPVLHRHPSAAHANPMLGRCQSCKSHVAIFISLSNLRPFPPPAPADRAAGGWGGARS